jgi:hypothetical protein
LLIYTFSAPGRILMGDLIKINAPTLAIEATGYNNGIIKNRS